MIAALLFCLIYFEIWHYLFGNSYVFHSKFWCRNCTFGLYFST